MKTALKVLLLAFIIIPLILLLLVRFTNGTISGGGKIILGYDELHKRFQFFEKRVYYLNGIDGPYLINDTLITVNERNEILKHALEADFVTVKVNQKVDQQFIVPLRDSINAPPALYSLPQKLTAISDIEGNFNAFTGFLESNGIIDTNLNWIYGNGHLVLPGDFVDRGNNVTAVLWLIYKLEAEAQKAGGRVHFILGNHEIMNIQGNFYNARDRYKKIAELLGNREDKNANNRVMYSQQSHLGKWLRSKNVLEKIGPYLFVHGGLSPRLLHQQLQIEEINQLIRENIDSNYYRRASPDSVLSFLMGTEGPLWYRGMVVDYKYYDKISNSALISLLERYNATKVVVGHTVVDHISTGFGGTIIYIDVKHGEEKYSDRTQGILIEDGRVYKISANGNKAILTSAE